MKHHKLRNWKFKFALPAMVMISAGVLSHAQDSDIIELPTTVVSGDLWQSELQDTTASVSVLSHVSLESAEYQHFDDVRALIPNLTSTGGTSRARYFQIRGIGENSQFEGETPDSAVAFFIDDLDFTGLGSVATLLDVKQVEVLRGPQAGAFGANAAGGMINIVSNDPTVFWTGKVGSTIGSDDLFSGTLAVGGPLSENDPEKVGIRFAMAKSQSNGFYENEYYGKDDSNERDEMAARLKLRWKVTDDFQLDATMLYADTNNGYDQFTMGSEAFKTQSDELGRDEQESLGLDLKASWMASDSITFTSKTAWMQTDSEYSYDADWTDASYAGFLETIRDREVVTQEFRLDGETDAITRWTVGAYYQTLNEDSDVLYRDGDPSGGEWWYGQVDVLSYYETETYAGFAQLQRELSDTTRLVVGVRYENHTVGFRSNSEEQGYYRGYLYDGGSKNEESVFGGKITLEHDFDENHMGFVSITKGYKAGGANSASFTTPDLPLTYEEESLWNVEAGLKSWLMDDKISTQVTAFYLYREDPQLRDSVGAGGFFRYLTVNGDSATHMGLEAEAQWIINSEWNMSAGLGLLDTTREAYMDPGGLVAERELANAPAYNYNIRLNYRNAEGVFGSVALMGRDAYYESNSHDYKREAMEVVNTSLGYRYENWTVSVWCRNLLDKEYSARIFFFDNGDGERRHEALADPLNAGVTVEYTF